MGSSMVCIWCSLVGAAALIGKAGRAEIAGRMLLKKSFGSIRNLGSEYGVGRSTVLNIVDEFKDKVDEAVAAARQRQLYENNPRHSQPVRAIEILHRLRSILVLLLI